MSSPDSAPRPKRSKANTPSSYNDDDADPDAESNYEGSDDDNNDKEDDYSQDREVDGSDVGGDDGEEAELELPKKRGPGRPRRDGSTPASHSGSSRRQSSGDTGGRKPLGRTCCSCEEYKLRDDFTKNQWRQGMLESKCRACIGEVVSRRHANAEVRRQFGGLGSVKKSASKSGAGASAHGPGNKISKRRRLLLKQQHKDEETAAIVTALQKWRREPYIRPRTYYDPPLPEEAQEKGDNAEEEVKEMEAGVEEKEETKEKGTEGDDDVITENFKANKSRPTGNTNNAKVGKSNKTGPHKIPPLMVKFEESPLPTDDPTIDLVGRYDIVYHHFYDGAQGLYQHHARQTRGTLELDTVFGDDAPLLGRVKWHPVLRSSSFLSHSPSELAPTTGDFEFRESLELEDDTGDDRFLSFRVTKPPNDLKFVGEDNSNTEKSQGSDGIPPLPPLLEAEAQQGANNKCKAKCKLFVVSERCAAGWSPADDPLDFSSNNRICFKTLKGAERIQRNFDAKAQKEMDDYLDPPSESPEKQSKGKKRKLKSAVAKSIADVQAKLWPPPVFFIEPGDLWFDVTWNLNVDYHDGTMGTIAMSSVIIARDRKPLKVMEEEL
jgi:hypothetical protein